MNKRRIGINIIANIAAFIITLAITFYLTPYIINELGMEAYGFFPLANAVVSYVVVIVTALNTIANRFISIEYHNQNYQQAQVYFNTILLIDIIISVALMIISTITILFLDKILQIPIHLVKDVKVLFLLLFFSSLTLMALSAFRTSTFVNNRVDTNAYINILKSILRAAVLIVLFTFFIPNIVYVGLASCAAFLFEAAMYGLVKRKLLRDMKVDLRLFNIQAYKALFKSGKWSIVNKANNILFIGLDLPIANIFLGALSASSLALAKNIPAQAMLLVQLITFSFSPALVERYAKNKDDLAANLARTFIPLTLFGSVILGGVIGIGDIFYQMWLPSANTELIYTLTLITMIPLFLNYGVMTIKYVYTLQDNVKIEAWVNGLSSIISIILVIVLLNITHLGLYAIAGISSLVLALQFFTFTIPYTSKRINRKPLFLLQYVLKALLCIGVTASWGLFIRSIMPISTWLDLAISAILIAIASLSINLFIVTKKGFRAYYFKKIKAVIRHRIEGSE